jgi:hypothetical protein
MREVSRVEKSFICEKSITRVEKLEIASLTSNSFKKSKFLSFFWICWTNSGSEKIFLFQFLA